MKEFLRDNDVSSKADTFKDVKESLRAKTKEELQKMIQPGGKEKLPVIIVLLISAFVQDPKYDGMDIDTFLDHVLRDNKAANGKE